MAGKPLKSELHHWWPRTLADHWTDGRGMVSVLRSDGQIHRAPPGAFGGITNAHHMKIGGPWDSTFEPIFNEADGELADFVRWLSTLDTPIVSDDQPSLSRIAPQRPSIDRLQQLARITASLLARSPSIRNSIKLTTEHYRHQFGLSEPKADKTLIALNQRGLYDAYHRYMRGGGRWAILFSDQREFVAGDGFFHNFPSSGNGLNAGRKLVLPILPTAAIVFMRPLSHPSEPRLVTLRLNADEVGELNSIVQIYASDQIFFREECPQITDDFGAGRHLQLRYHGHGWLDALLDDLSQYNLWGRDGAPGRCYESPFSEALKGNRWFESFLTEHD